MRPSPFALAPIALAAMLALAAPAAALDAGDRTIVPGQRAGAILKTTAPADIAKIFGAARVQESKIGYDGDEFPGVVVHRGTADEVQVAFTADAKRILFVRVVGRNWTTPSGIRIGTTLAALERVNGGPFNLNGFGWGLGGLVLADPPNKIVSDGLSVGLAYDRPASAALTRQAEGDRVLSSRHPALRKLKVRVYFIQVEFQP